MRRHHYDKKRHRIYFNCPVKRPTHKNNKEIWVSYPEECPNKILCQPDTVTGPLVYVRSDQDPRLYPSIPRESQQFKDIMKLRTACERSNSIKKVTHKLENSPCRNSTHYLFRLYLISIIEHTKVWLAEDKKQFGDDWKNLLPFNNPINTDNEI